MNSNLLVGIFGACWGWLFVMIFILAGGVADFVAVASKPFAKGAVVCLRLISFAAALFFLLALAWGISQEFLRQYPPERGKDFAAAFLVGFLAFFIVPRIEQALRSKRN